jgi:hypothetical protein
MRIRVMMAAALVSAAMLSAATPARSEEKMSYVVLKGGQWAVQSDKLTDENVGSFGEIAFGGKFNPFLGAEFGVGRYEAKGTYRTSRADIHTTPISLSLRLGVPIAIVEPYFILGGGAYFTTIDIGSISTRIVKPGYHAGLGVDINLGALLLGVEGRYFSTTGQTFDADISLHGYALAAKAGIRF